MEAVKLLELIQKGESSRVQFKERLPHQDSVAQEMVAFSNSQGGLLIIGVNDKTGELNGLTFQEIQATNQQLANVASQSVNPPIFLTTETVSVNNNNLILVSIKEGISKPYKDRLGSIYIKNGSDKRRVISNEEIARLLQNSKIMFADEMPIHGATASDIDIDYYKIIFNKRFEPKGITYDTSGIDLTTSLQNQQLYKNGALTLTGLLVFCENRHSYRPQFSIQCFSTDNTDLLGDDFTDNEPAFEGNLEQVYFQALNFIGRNMKKIPSGSSFNSELRWQIPKTVFEETLVNALVHRDYFINTTIKVFMFSDRIEIISPGKLPNTQTEATIVNGVSIPRNPVLQSLAQYVLPYKGAGTGLMRAVYQYKDISFFNDIKNERFIVSIKRP